MFLLTRPSSSSVARFIRDSHDLDYSYGPVGVSQRHGDALQGWDLDETRAVIGRGRADFLRARAALASWGQFRLGWAELGPATPSTDVGTNVAVLIRHLGFWSLNGARVVYRTGDEQDERFGVAYGTLTNHSEAGEELFEVSRDLATDEVIYRIRAVSKPRAPLARLGYPYVRHLQARFRRDSVNVMRRQVS
jgi:uncharacterized protein (UPF0548 family)